MVTHAAQPLVRPETLAMVAEWRNRDRQLLSEQENQPDDFLDRWLPEAAAHLDAGWNGYGTAPSAEISIRYCMMMTGGDEARNYAAKWASWCMREAARRYAEGHHSNPLTDPRPAVGGLGSAFPKP